MPGFEVIGKEEFEEIKEIFEKSNVLFRHGFDILRNGVYKVREFEKEFAHYMGCEDALAVTSGSAALRVAMAALGIGKGDEVITQAFTFVATVEAIIESGAQPVIAEINETLNIDPRDMEQKITEKTKAVIVVHMLGIPSDMDDILRIAKQHEIAVVEDTAWGCGGRLGGRCLGTMGDIGTFSFDFAKTMTTGEGGMLLCRDNVVLERARAYHDHGHENNASLPRWEDSRSGSGFNYRMMELQGAVGLAQLRKLDNVIAMQRLNKMSISNAIKDLPGISFRKSPEHTEETADALIFFVQNPHIARKCRTELVNNGVGTKILPEAITWHFAGTWDHMPELVSRHPKLSEAFPVTKKILSHAVAIPILVKMAEDTPEKIRKALIRVLC